MAQDYEQPKIVILQCDNGREQGSVEHFLQHVENMEDGKLVSLFKMMPHEVLDLKDTIRRSEI